MYCAQVMKSFPIYDHSSAARYSGDSLGTYLSRYVSSYSFLSSDLVPLVLEPSQDLDRPVLPPLGCLVGVELQRLLGPHPFLHRDGLLEPRLHARRLQHGRVENGGEDRVVVGACEILCGGVN